MASYCLDESDLINLAKMAYELGYFGYMELKDSKCESLVLEFMEQNKTKLEKKSTNSIFAGNEFSASSLSGYSGSTFVVSSNVVGPGFE